MTSTPEHHQDGTHVSAPQQPDPFTPPTRPEDEDWRPGETEADREARLQLQADAAAEPARDLGAEWSEQQGEDSSS